MDSKHGRTTSSVTCHHCLWIAHMVERHQVGHAIIAFGPYTWSKNVGRGKKSPPFDSTHGQTTSGVLCHQRLWTAHTVERRRACNAIISFGQHTRSNYVRRGMPSLPLSSTNGRTTSGVACHHHLWAAHTVERRWTWHASIALRQHPQSKDIGRVMTSPPLDSTQGRTTSGIKSHHCLRTAHTVKRHREWHAIIALGWPTWSNDVWRGMPSSPLGSTHGRMTSGVA